MSEEIENYLDFKLKTYASLSVKDIPMIELRQFSCELAAYIDGKSSPKHDVTGEQKQPSLISDFDTNEKPLFSTDHDTKPRNRETRAILSYLHDNVKRFGQKLIISPKIINMESPDLKKFDMQVTHISNHVYRQFFPNASFSYRRLRPIEDHVFEVTVCERRD